MPVDVEDLDGGVRAITLNRPPANALDGDLVDELRTTFLAADEDDAVRAVVVRGNERFFSAGLDLKKMAMGEADRIKNFGSDDGVSALWHLKKPTIAEVRGHAIAGGAILALACDLRIACSSPKKIGLNETAIGLAFPLGALEIARSALPKRFFARIILEAELHAPEAALELGFLDEVVPEEALGPRCLELARKLGAYPAGAYAHNQALVRKPSIDRCAAESSEDRERHLAVWTSEETIRAFLTRAQGLSSKD